VRPYVSQADGQQPTRSGRIPATLPDTDGGVATSRASDPVVGERVDTRPTRRARRSWDPLDRIVEMSPDPAVARSEWSAPWIAPSAWGRDDRQDRSLFEPATGSLSDVAAPWAPPREQPLPSRRALRAQERSVASRSSVTDTRPAIDTRPATDDPGSRTAGRRIAKSGVLAVTAVGVVAASAPNGFSALGWRLPSPPANPSAQAALIGLAGSGAVPASVTSLNLNLPSAPQAGTALARADRESPDRIDAARARQLAAALDRRTQAATARAGAVADGAGRTLVDVARAQVLAEAARKAKITQRVSRNTVRDPRAYAQLLLQERGWAGQFTCLNLLWNRESGWNYQATNPSSGAYGIPQALPGYKMATIASDWRTNPATQIKWGLNYIAERYGNPCGAWGHSQATGWY
jgi:hypothetical protein